jgi:hypothetical protein
MAFQQFCFFGVDRILAKLALIDSPGASRGWYAYPTMFFWRAWFFKQILPSLGHLDGWKNPSHLVGEKNKLLDSGSQPHLRECRTVEVHTDAPIINLDAEQMKVMQSELGRQTDLRFMFTIAAGLGYCAVLTTIRESDCQHGAVCVVKSDPQRPLAVRLRSSQGNFNHEGRAWNLHRGLGGSVYGVLSQTDISEVPVATD